MNRLLPVSEVARLLGDKQKLCIQVDKRKGSYSLTRLAQSRSGQKIWRCTKVSKTLLELLDGLEYSLDENGSICFGNEESYREFFRRTERMAEQYGNKENSN